MLLSADSSRLPRHFVLHLAKPLMVKVGSVQGDSDGAVLIPSGSGSGSGSKSSSKSSSRSSMADGSDTATAAATATETKSKRVHKSRSLNVRLRAWGQDDEDNPYTAEQVRPERLRTKSELQPEPEVG